MYPALTDEALMGLIQQSNPVALETLFNRYYKTLCQLCTVYTKDYTVAEEITANLFNRDTAILNVKSYLFVAAKNLSLNHIQKKKDPVHSIEDIDLQSHMLKDRDNPFKILSGRESYNKILNLIDTLPASQRQVLLMSRIDNLDKNEIARVLGISVRTVETTLYQSIKKLRQLLKGQHNFTSEG